MVSRKFSRGAKYAGNIPVETRLAAQKTPNIVRQPERRFATRAWIICCRHCRIMSRTSALLLWIIAYSKGFRKSFWKLKLVSSCFSKKRIASCRRESKAKKDTLAFVWLQTLFAKGEGQEMLPNRIAGSLTWLKCSPSMFHICDHSSLIRFML